MGIPMFSCFFLPLGQLLPFTTGKKLSTLYSLSGSFGAGEEREKWS